MAKEKLLSVLAYGGFPLQAHQVVEGILAQLPDVENDPDVVDRRERKRRAS